MLIDCPKCRAKVDAKVLETAVIVSDVGDSRYAFLRCPVCTQPMFARQEREAFSHSEDDEWETAERLWPESTKFPRAIPKAIRDSLTEAARCCNCGAFTASVAMAGRALEAWFGTSRRLRCILGRACWNSISKGLSIAAFSIGRRHCI
jgi:hypothetical protein